jgi:hypothetical protein
LQIKKDPNSKSINKTNTIPNPRTNFDGLMPPTLEESVCNCGTESNYSSPSFFMRESNWSIVMILFNEFLFFEGSEKLDIFFL